MNAFFLLLFSAIGVQLGSADTQSLCGGEIKQFATQNKNFVLSCPASGLATLRFDPGVQSPQTSVGTSPLNNQIVYVVIFNSQEATKLSSFINNGASYTSGEQIVLDLNNGTQIKEARASIRCTKKNPNNIAYDSCQVVAVANQAFSEKHPNQ